MSEPDPTGQPPDRPPGMGSGGILTVPLPPLSLPPMRTENYSTYSPHSIYVSNYSSPLSNQLLHSPMMTSLSSSSVSPSISSSPTSFSPSQSRLATPSPKQPLAQAIVTHQPILQRILTSSPIEKVKSIQPSGKQYSISVESVSKQSPQQSNFRVPHIPDVPGCSTNNVYTQKSTSHQKRSNVSIETLPLPSTSYANQANYSIETTSLPVNGRSSQVKTYSNENISSSFPSASNVMSIQPGLRPPPPGGGILDGRKMRPPEIGMEHSHSYSTIELPSSHNQTKQKLYIAAVTPQLNNTTSSVPSGEQYQANNLSTQNGSTVNRPIEMGSKKNKGVNDSRNEGRKTSAKAKTKSSTTAVARNSGSKKQPNVVIEHHDLPPSYQSGQPLFTTIPSTMTLTSQGEMTAIVEQKLIEEIPIKNVVAQHLPSFLQTQAVYHHQQRNNASTMLSLNIEKESTTATATVTTVPHRYTAPPDHRPMLQSTSATSELIARNNDIRKSNSNNNQPFPVKTISHPNMSVQKVEPLLIKANHPISLKSNSVVEQELNPVQHLSSNQSTNLSISCLPSSSNSYPSETKNNIEEEKVLSRMEMSDAKPKTQSLRKMDSNNTMSSQPPLGQEIIRVEETMKKMSAQATKDVSHTSSTQRMNKEPEEVANSQHKQRSPQLTASEKKKDRITAESMVTSENKKREPAKILSRHQMQKMKILQNMPKALAIMKKALQPSPQQMQPSSHSSSTVLKHQHTVVPTKNGRAHAAEQPIQSSISKKNISINAKNAMNPPPATTSNKQVNLLKQRSLQERLQFLKTLIVKQQELRDKAIADKSVPSAQPETSSVTVPSSSSTQNIVDTEKAQIKAAQRKIMTELLKPRDQNEKNVKPEAKALSLAHIIAQSVALSHASVWKTKGKLPMKVPVTVLKTAPLTTVSSTGQSKPAKHVLTAKEREEHQSLLYHQKLLLEVQRKENREEQMRKNKKIAELQRKRNEYLLANHRKIMNLVVPEPSTECHPKIDAVQALAPLYVREYDYTNRYKKEYRKLKKQLAILVYENECYREEIRILQLKLLRIERDNNFLMDRLVELEELSDSSDDDSDYSLSTVCSIPEKRGRNVAYEETSDDDSDDEEVEDEEDDDGSVGSTESSSSTQKDTVEDEEEDEESTASSGADSDESEEEDDEGEADYTSVEEDGSSSSDVEKETKSSPPSPTPSSSKQTSKSNVVASKSKKIQPSAKQKKPSVVATRIEEKPKSEEVKVDAAQPKQNASGRPYRERRIPIHMLDADTPIPAGRRIIIENNRPKVNSRILSTSVQPKPAAVSLRSVRKSEKKGKSETSKKL